MHAAEKQMFSDVFLVMLMNGTIILIICAVHHERVLKNKRKELPLLQASFEVISSQNFVSDNV